jgi:MYXO-CTERM domain-containing protein
MRRTWLLVALVSILGATARADVVFAPPRADGAPRIAMPFARPGRNFAIVVDTAGIAATQMATQAGITSLQDSWWGRTQPWEDVDVVIWFTTVNDWRYAAFYSPLANDIDGLGYGEHLSEQTGQSFPDVFDFSPDTLSGIVVANHYFTYLSDPWWLPLVIGQELGHKWCCFLRESTGVTSPHELLGRDRSHWSYFLETGSSPMEGNSWVWDGASTFTTATADVYESGNFVTPFSQLDLYLMGLLPASQVDPFAVIQSPNVGGQQDLFGDTINAASPPQYQGDVTITGTRFEFTIDDVIARNGPRVPASWDGAFRVAFVLLVQPGEEEDQTIRNGMSTVVDRAMEIWSESTGGLSTLVNVTTATFGELGDACNGASSSCAAGLECASFDGSPVCVAPCEGVCAGGCCMDSDGGGQHCYPPELAGCTPPTHDTGDRCEDGIPCDAGTCWADPEFGVSYCSGPCDGGCPAGMSCGDDDQCHWDESPPGATGAPCDAGDDCDSNLCINGHCASFCDPAGDDCPGNTVCQPTSGDAHVCVYSSGSGGGDGCAVSTRGNGGAPMAILAGLALALAIAYRRRTSR